MSSLPDFTNLSAVLTWIAIGGGAPFLAMQAFSYLAELWPAWHDFPKVVKYLAPPLLAVGLAFAANYGLKSAGLIETLSPFWVLITQVVIGWLGSQKGYMDTKKAGYGAKYANVNQLKG